LKPAAIYARVSSEEQATEGTSLESQVAACRRYAAANGLNVVATFMEDWPAPTLARPELDRLRDLVATNELAAVIIYKLDRLSRDTADTLALLKEFKAHSVELRSATVAIEDSPEGKMMLTMLAAIAEYERTQIIERSRRGKRQRALQGKVIVTT
jgi:site-specific DNA recombinase